MSETVEVKINPVTGAKPQIKKPTAPQPTIKPVLKTETAEPTFNVHVEDAADVQYKKDHVMVKGIFRNLETPGGILKFPYRKYRQDRIENYTLLDGQVHEVPMMVANHLNENCSVPQYAHIPGSTTVQAVGLNSAALSGLTPAGTLTNLTRVGKFSRFAFQPVGFVASPSYIEAQTIAQARR